MDYLHDQTLHPLGQCLSATSSKILKTALYGFISQESGEDFVFIKHLLQLPE